MNRQQPRAEGRAPTPKPTNEAAGALVGQGFKDRISWVAARLFLERHPVAESEMEP